jgi:hypothetical protein
MWITASIRPVTIKEMQYTCITIEYQEFNPYGCIPPSLDRILGVCADLVEVFDADKLDFIHASVCLEDLVFSIS